MSQIRNLKLGQLEQLRKRISLIELRAASSCFIVEMKAVSVRDDLSKLDIDAILQSAKDLHESVTELRKAKEDADKLNDELYD